MSFYVLLEYYTLFILDLVRSTGASPNPEVSSILFYRRLKKYIYIYISYLSLLLEKKYFFLGLKYVRRRLTSLLCKVWSWKECPGRYHKWFTINDPSHQGASL